MKYIYNASGSDKSYAGQTSPNGEYYPIQDGSLSAFQRDANLLSDLANSIVKMSSNGTSVINGSAADHVSFLLSYDLSPKTSDNRQIVAINRIPSGYTVYPTGKSDALQASGYRAGTDMIFDADNKTKRLQMIGPWYGIGGRVIWEGADLSDYMDAYLKAPATVGANSAGDFDKYGIGGPYNMYIPASPGQGAWSLDLDEKHTGTSVLKCVPVPVAGNTGFFDFDIETNSITINAQEKGGYNLYDFEATLFCFASRCWGRKQDGAESSLEIPDVVGKLIPPQWVIDFSLVTSKTENIKAGLIMITAIKGNM